MADFSETQRIDRGLLIFVSVLTLLAILGPFVMVYQELTGNNQNEKLSDYLLVMSGVVIFTVGILALIASQRLQIEINRFRLRFKMVPFVNWREITPDEVESFRVARSQWFQKLRKSRVHYNPFTKKWSYMLTRKFFVELKLKSGKTIVLSTTRPEEIATAMEKFLAREV